MTNTASPELKHQPEKTAVWPDSTRPSLSFLPPKIRGARSRRKAIRQTAMGSLALLLLTAGAFTAVAMGTSGAAGDLEDAKAAGSVHTKYLADNAPFTDYYNGFDDRKAAVAAALDQDTAFSRIFGEVNNANTVGATFTSMSQAEGEGACPRGDLFAPSAAVGCLSVAGFASNIEDIGKFATSMESNNELLTDPYVTESSDAEGRVAFKLTVGYTDKAFSLKGAKFLLPAEVTAESAPTTPAEPIEEATP